MNQVTIILVEPEIGENVGAVARAMKNMGLCSLRLVKPVSDWKKKGKILAVSAVDVLENAKTFETTQEAIQDLHTVIGTSRRGGPKRGIFHDFSKTIKRVKKTTPSRQVGIMFGRESKGLDNDSLDLCDWFTTIPVDPAMPSINLAQAVMIFCFSLFDHSMQLPPQRPKRGAPGKKKKENNATGEEVYLSKGEVKVVLDRVEEALLTLGYTKKSRKVPRIRRTLGRLLKRSGVLECEAQMFKGISQRICEKMNS